MFKSQNYKIKSGSFNFLKDKILSSEGNILSLKVKLSIFKVKM